MDHPKIYVGWDCREACAFDVCLYAIQRHASDLVEIVPLKQKALPAMGVALPGGEGTGAPRVNCRRPGHCSLARFFLPALSGFKGWALFVSSDMLVQADIYDLWRLRDDRFAVMAVHHGETESDHGGWSRLLLWNCAHPANRALSAERLRGADPTWLRRFGWLKESAIGRLPKEWHWLEGRSEPMPAPKIIEFAKQQPWRREPGCCDLVDRWHREARRVYGDGDIGAEMVAASQPAAT